MSTTPLKDPISKDKRSCQLCFENVVENKAHFCFGVSLVHVHWNGLLSLLQNVVLDNRKSRCQLDHEVDINFFLMEAIAYCYF